MKCNKCDCDALKKDGEWYTCLNCGNVMFDTTVGSDEAVSPTKAIEKLESTMSLIEEYDQPTIEEEEEVITKKKKKSFLREAIEFLFPIVLAVIIAIVLKTFVFANAIVPTGSMLNTIQEKDRVIASRVSYSFNDPERYDVIIFKYPDDETQAYVKRTIGLPGETVQIVKGVVYVTKTDGQTVKLDTSFITNCEPTGDYGPYTVPEDAYFVMGDNRNDSWDSRSWENKFVYRDKIIGKVMFRYYPSIGKIK